MSVSCLLLFVLPRDLFGGLIVRFPIVSHSIGQLNPIVGLFWRTWLEKCMDAAWIVLPAHGEHRVIWGVQGA